MQRVGEAEDAKETGGSLLAAAGSGAPSPELGLQTLNPIAVVVDPVRADDGEGVEAIAEYLQRHAGLHFSLGLVEMPIYVMPDGGRLVVPRVLARTAVVTRNVVAVPEGCALAEEGDPVDEVDAEISLDRKALGDERLRFWTEFMTYLRIDDPEQARPNAAHLGYLNVMMPAPSGSSWLTVYREARKNTVGIFLSSHRGTAGDYAMAAVAEDWDRVAPELGGTSSRFERDGRWTVGDVRKFGSLDWSAPTEWSGWKVSSGLVSAPAVAWPVEPVG